VKLQLLEPAEHSAVMALPLADELASWVHDAGFDVAGIHRHVVRSFEHDDVTYVVNKLPDRLVDREFRLPGHLADQQLPTVAVVGSVTGRAGNDGEGLLITRSLDYSLPYRTLLSGRGLHTPYHGQRQLDLNIATENVAGGLADLQAAGRLATEIDPWTPHSASSALNQQLWDELTSPEEFSSHETSARLPGPTWVSTTRSQSTSPRY
jgi:hypothetical protein